MATAKLNSKLKNPLKYTTIAMLPAQQHTHATFAHNLGPSSSDPITNGLRLKRRRPAGGGRKGWLLGSLRPFPTGWASAFSMGQIWTPIKHLPICSCNHMIPPERAGGRGRDVGLILNTAFLIQEIVWGNIQYTDFIQNLLFSSLKASWVTWWKCQQGVSN